MSRLKRGVARQALRLGGLAIVALATVSAGDWLLHGFDDAKPGAAGRQMLANALSGEAIASPRAGVAMTAPRQAASAPLLDGEKDEASEIEAPSNLPVQLAALDDAKPPAADPAPETSRAPGLREDPIIDETLDGGALRFAVGDRLRVTVFERVDKGGDRPLYLVRADMSGETMVEADGGAPLPFLGVLAAYEQTPSQFIADVRRRAESLLGAQPRVTVSIMSRQPVFVGGGAINARAVDYMPGLLLTQAVTLAGGAKLDSDRLWQQIDLAREEERLHNAERSLSLLSAKLTVLRAEAAAAKAAERGGDTTASEKIETASPDKAYRYDLERAQRLRALERAEIAQQLAATEAEIESLDAELTHLRDHVKDLEGVVAEKSLRTAEAEKLLGRGLTTQASLNTLESQLRLDQVRYSEVRATILRVQTQRQQLGHRLLQFQLQERAQREREIAEAEIAVRQAEATITALSNLIDQARLRETTQRREQESGAGALTYVIARRTPDGVEEIPADLYTALQPGDVVRVDYGGGVMVKASLEEASTSGAALPPQ